MNLLLFLYNLNTSAERFYVRLKKKINKKKRRQNWKSAKLYHRLVLVRSGWPLSKPEWLLSPSLEELEPELIIYRKLLGVAGGL